MFNKIQNFFRELREKDESVKKWWLILFTSGTMIVVIGFWTLYLNATVENFNKPQQVQKENFLGIFKNGLGIAAKEAAVKLNGLMASLKSVASQTNSITIEGAGAGFVVKKDLKEIKPTKLP